MYSPFKNAGLCPSLQVFYGNTQIWIMHAACYLYLVYKHPNTECLRICGRLWEVVNFGQDKHSLTLGSTFLSVGRILKSFLHTQSPSGRPVLVVTPPAASSQASFPTARESSRILKSCFLEAWWVSTAEENFQNQYSHPYKEGNTFCACQGTLGCHPFCLLYEGTTK